MPTVKRFVIGIKTASKMFRVSSLGGLITDRLLSIRGKELSSDFFDTIGSEKDRAGIQLHNAAKGNYVRFDLENIVFTKDFYESGHHFRFEDVLKEFRAVWQEANAELQIKDIRRIGMVCEYRFPLANKAGGGDLLDALTRLKSATDTQVGRFFLRFEERSKNTDGNFPDTKKNDGGFLNKILEIYDSREDAENPAEGMYNVNIDVQRYFSPSFGGNTVDEALKLYNTQYVPTAKLEFERLRKLGLIDG